MTKLSVERKIENHRVKWSESRRKGSVLYLINIACQFTDRLACRQAAQRSFFFQFAACRPRIVINVLQSVLGFYCRV